MATIIPFPVKNMTPMWGLTVQECDAIQAVAYDLMLQGHVTGIGVEDVQWRTFVFDSNGEPYSIRREKGVCYLTNREHKTLVHNRRFEIVLKALQMLLATKSEGAF